MHELRTRLLQTINVLRHPWHLSSLPTIISLETSLACNRRCSYCPQSLAPKIQKRVSPEIWNRFLFRLAELGWRGYVCVTSYNEFTLLPDCEDYIRDLSSIGCRPMIFTNGDRPQRLLDCLDAGAKRIIITQHEPTYPGWLPALQPVLKRGGRRIKLQRLEVLHTHAGRTAHIPQDRPIYTQSRCISNVAGLAITIDGYAKLCCLDYDNNYLFGHINIFPLLTIWKQMSTVRSKLRRGIPATKLCTTCLNPNQTT